MSLVQSISIDSSSSTGTMATIAPGDSLGHAANDLYENRDHFQAIFTNDSRFFDTSLHIFKSYAALGHIELNEKKYRKYSIASLAAPSNGRKSRWRPRLLGFEHRDHHNGTLKGFLTPTLLRKHDRSPSIRSNSGISSNEKMDRQQKSSMVVQYQPQIVPAINTPNDDISEESEITITRL